MERSRSLALGYLFAAWLGALGGGMLVLVTTRAIPKIMSRVMEQMMPRMMENMREQMKQCGNLPDT